MAVRVAHYPEGTDMVKVTTDRATLKDALAQLKRAVPALQGVRVTALEHGELELAATDLETACVASIEADVAEPGAFLVDRKALTSAVKSGGERVTLAEDDDGECVWLDLDGAVVTLRTMVMDDYPGLPAPAPLGASLAPDTVDRLARVAVAAHTDEGRPVLMGVSFGADGRVAATDSFRLLWTSAGGDAHQLAALAGALVPARAVRAVARWSTDGAVVQAGLALDQPEYPNASAGMVTFAGAHHAGPKRARREVYLTLTVRTIVGTFPNWPNLIPPDDDERVSVTVVRDELAAAARDVGRIAGGAANVPVRLAPADGPTSAVTLTCGTAATGEASTTVAVTDGAELPEIALNPAYLAQVVDALDYEVVRVSVRHASKPVLLVGDRVRALLMPMRVQ